MHRVASTGNTANASRPRKERRLTYVLSGFDDSKHSSGINCLTVSSSPLPSDSSCDFLFSGSRDGTLKRWELKDDAAVCCATFESHVDWVNDCVFTGSDTLVSCSSDTTIKTWRAFSNGTCTKTFRQHSDYVTSLAAAKHSNIVASGGLGGEVFVWDLEAASIPISKAAMVDSSVDPSHDGNFSSGLSSQIANDRPNIVNNSSATSSASSLHGYTPISAKGHKDSVYALAMNDAGTTLVSGGTEKAVRVWDPRTGTKQMKLKGHSDNLRALVLDPSGRFCLSGSSDSMIRLWDLGQQRCVHSYAVHTDSVWALASNPAFNHAYSGGRDLSIYCTDLSSRETTLISAQEHPVLRLAFQGDDWLWVATSDSSICKWATKERSNVEDLQSASSFMAGSLPFARARACLEGTIPVPLNKEPTFVIQGTAGIVRHAILNDRQHVLTKDAASIVKLWEITRGAVISDFGKISFEDKEKELFEMVSVPSWFTMDTRLGSISIHLDTPSCFAAEMYAVDLRVPGASEEQKINLGQETLRGLFAHWLARRRQKVFAQHVVTNGDIPGNTESGHSNHSIARGGNTDDANHNAGVLPAFEFSASSPASIITEGSQGGPWRKKITELDGTEDEKDLPSWILDCLQHGRLPSKDHAKCSFYLHPYEGTTVQVLTQGKLSAPKILRINKVINYVLEKLVLDKPVDDSSSDSSLSGLPQQASASGFRSGMRVWQQKLKPDVEILCNNQVLPLDMSLATVRAYVWKKPEDLVLHYRVATNR